MKNLFNRLTTLSKNLIGAAVVALVFVVSHVVHVPAKPVEVQRVVVVVTPTASPSATVVPTVFVAPKHVVVPVVTKAVVVPSK